MYCYFPEPSAITILSKEKESEDWKPVSYVIDLFSTNKECYILDENYPFRAIYFIFIFFHNRRKNGRNYKYFLWYVWNNFTSFVKLSIILKIRQKFHT